MGANTLRVRRRQGGFGDYYNGYVPQAGDGIPPQPVFWAPLQTTLVPTMSGTSGGTPTFTRADGADGRATFTDFEGRIVPVRAGEARFNGARRVYNQADTASEDNGVGLRSTSNCTIPSATTVSMNVDGASYFHRASTIATGSGVVVRARAKLATQSGTRQIILRLTGASSSANTSSVNVTITTVPQVITLTTTFTADRGVAMLGIDNRASSGATDTSTGTVIFTEQQLELVTGQSNQNPSEYVSVGVASAPYHGANVDGVKYLDTLNGNTVASNVVTEATGARISSSTAKWGQLPGLSGSKFSTASTGPTITGSFTATIDFDGTPTGNCHLLHKLSGNDGFQIRFLTNGYFQVTICNGSAQNTSGGFGQVTVGTRHQLVFNWIDGVGFTYSVDGGATSAVQAFAYTLTSANIGLTVGEISSGALAGRVWRATITNGSGTRLYDFNPNDYTSGSTFASSTTGETWTLNGSVKVFGSTDATYGIPSQWDSKGPFGYLSEGSRQNICLQSNTFDNAAWTTSSSQSTVAAAQYTAPDGTLTGYKLTASGVAQYLTQAVTNSTATTFTLSVYARYVDNQWIRLELGDGTGVKYFRAYFDVQNGVVGGNAQAGAGFTYTSSAISSVGNGWYRLQLVGATTGVNLYPVIVVAAGNNNTASTNAASIGIFGAQLEQASFASAYIPTTSAAVTRAADSLTYTYAGNASQVIGTVCCETQTEWTTQNFNGNGAGLITFGGAFQTSVLGAYYTEAATILKSNDGATNVSVTGSSMATAIRKAAATWGNNARVVYLAGTASSTGTYSGNVGTNALGIGTGSGVDGMGAWFGTIRNVRTGSSVLTSAQIAVWQA